MRIFIVLVLCSLGFGRSTAATETPAQAEGRKIEALINHIATLKNAVFIRNGSEYDAASAAKFLRGKWAHQGASVKTAHDFIDQVASKSSTSGLPYLIKLGNGQTIKCRDFLLQRLAELEAVPRSSPDP